MESLYRKYRPLTFDSVVGQQHIVSTLEHAITEGRLSHAYLFCGPRGTGKTTMARILAKALLCRNAEAARAEGASGCMPDGTCEECELIAEGNHPDVYELDAASRTGVDNVREEIINSVNFETGKKLHMAKEQIQALMRRNDAICQEMGLPVFDAPTQQARGMGGAEYHTALKGQSWKLRLMNTIDECMKYAADKDAFVSLMESEGYAVRWESGRKYITYTTPDGLKCRDNKLHEAKSCKEAMEHEFRIRAELVKRKLRRAAETDGGIEADESAEQRTAVCATAAADPAHCDPVRSAAGDEQADGAGRRNKLGAGGNSEDPAGAETTHRPDAGAAVSDGDAEIADRDEQTAGTGWEPEREVFLQVDRLASGFQPAGGPQVDHAGADPWHGGTGRVVWRGGDPQPVPLIPAVAGLTAAGTLMDEDENAEEKRRRMEAKIAAENFGAAIGFAAGAALAVKEKLDEQSAREEQKKQQQQTMGGL